MVRSTQPPWGDDDPRRWPDDWREAWEERAAIMEFDGGLPRARAELEAWRLLRDRVAR
ncbi:MAG: hypothetical protein H6713_09200 [Myxococcales bacterium]|nr:hypothetical protein [Myxococcales bacterium]MCB9750164.1 hypothetical protein [Myxococcales bacterium]